MKETVFEILTNRKIAQNTYETVLSGDISDIERPGQFVNIRLDGFYLRRPISVCDADNGKLTIIYKAVGGGTEMLSQLASGERLNILTGLGNGYNTDNSGQNPLLIGGGAGVPPMYLLAKRLIGQGKSVTVVMGFGKAEEVFYDEKFLALGASVRITTVDGSCGTLGFVTDAIPDDYSYFYACGPEPMLKSVYVKSKTSGEFSFEERMGCGFGACMGCSCKTKYGSKRICRDGPVLTKEEIIW